MKRTAPTMTEVSLGHRELPSPHLHRIDCNCTKKIRAVPMSLSTPNKSGVCNFDFYIPANENEQKYSIKIGCWCWSFLYCAGTLTIWLQPPSFSIVTLHFGHSFVFAAIQLDVSESSSHFLIHFFKKRHSTGSCQFSPHSKQNTCAHLHVTGRDST